MLSQSEIASFHERGFLVLRSVFQGKELSMLRAAANRVSDEGIAGRSGDHLYHEFPDGQRVYRRSERMWQRDPVFRAVTVNPRLLAAIGQCVGDAFFPWNDSLVVKAPGRGAPVPWHQDPPYGERERTGTFPVPNFTTDIYLDRSDESNGCVYAIPGMHLQGHVAIGATPDEEWFGDPRATPLAMEPGDVLFHALSLPHGSRATKNSAMRRTLYIHYLAQEVYEDGYASLPWAKEKPGWSAEVRYRTQSMFDARDALGLSARGELGAYGVAMDDSGIRFERAPTSPERAWSDPGRWRMKRP